ncbi:hypothetical protein RND81_09G123000 [Saponaria officinalis]|uniref:Aspartate racemase n=1 Tax=Saponaria officinalis TaxID=3572 RepID=A0AAW1IKQ6_SAPOF
MNVTRMFDGSMSMTFYTVNYPANVSLKTFYFKHETVKNTRVTLALANSPSSTLVHISESHNSHKCGRNFVPNKDGSLDRSNTVGIIGGVSVDSTLDFLKKLVEWGSKEGKECPPFTLCSDPKLGDDLLNYELASFPSLYTRKRPCNVDHSTILENLRRKKAFLEQGGARCLVMPCHLLHMWHADVSDGCDVPILHMAECVARELKEAKLRPLEAGCSSRIGLVATDAILKSGYYQKKLQNEGFEVVLPDKATMEHTVIPAIEALDRTDIEGARNLLRIALQVLLVRAVNVVIIASHEMCELLPQDDPLRKKCVNPIDALVRSTIKWYRSVEQSS